MPTSPGATPEAIAQPAGRGGEARRTRPFRGSGSMQGVRWVGTDLRNRKHMPEGCRTACGYRHTAQCRPPRGARRGVKLLIAVAVRAVRRHAPIIRDKPAIGLERAVVGSARIYERIAHGRGRAGQVSGDEGVKTLIPTHEARYEHIS